MDGNLPPTKVSPGHLSAVRGYRPWFLTDASFALAIAVNGFALPILVLLEGGTASEAGTVSAIGAATAGVSHVFGGWLQDTINKRSLVILSSVAGMALFISGVLLLATGQFTFITASALACLLGLRAGLVGSTTNVMLRSFIPASLLPKAIAVNQARDASIEFLGPPAAGFLLEVGRAFPFVTNAVLNLCALLASLFLPKAIFDPEASSTGEVRKPVSVREVLAGFGYMWRSPLLRTISITGNLALAMFNTAILVTTWEILSRENSAVAASLVNTGVAVGVVIGAVFAPKFASRFQGGALVLCAYLLPLVSLIGLLLVEHTFAKVAFLIPAMFLLPAGSAVMGSIQMLSVPRSALGRFVAAIGLVELTLTAITTVAVSSLYEHFGYTPTLLVSVAVVAASLVHLASTSRLRHIPTSDKYEEYVAEESCET